MDTLVLGSISSVQTPAQEKYLSVPAWSVACVVCAEYVRTTYQKSGMYARTRVRKERWWELQIASFRMGTRLHAKTGRRLLFLEGHSP